MEPKITIQIPTYKNHSQLQTTLASLHKYDTSPYLVRVINNDPSGGIYVEEICQKFVGVEVIHGGGNIGWMGAHNLALKTCTTPLVCLLNDDVVFLPCDDGDFFERLTAYFSDPKVGATGPSSNFGMGGQNLWGIEYPNVYESTLLIGFCVVMRTDLIKEIGGLDETLPGGDDFDWCIRIRDAGYKLIVDRTCFLHHIGNQTGGRLHNDWDGVVHQENTVNAIVRKHGVRKWHDTMQSKVLKPISDLA